MTSVVLSTGQNCVEAGGNQGVFFTPANAMPMDIQDVKAKPSTAPISVPFAVARGKKAPRKNMPDSGPLKDASNVCYRPAYHSYQHCNTTGRSSEKYNCYLG